MTTPGSNNISLEARRGDDSDHKNNRVSTSDMTDCVDCGDDPIDLVEAALEDLIFPAPATAVCHGEDGGFESVLDDFVFPTKRENVAFRPAVQEEHEKKAVQTVVDWTDPPVNESSAPSSPAVVIVKDTNLLESFLQIETCVGGSIDHRSHDDNESKADQLMTLAFHHRLAQHCQQSGTNQRQKLLMTMMEKKEQNATDQTMKMSATREKKRVGPGQLIKRMVAHRRSSSLSSKQEMDAQASPVGKVLDTQELEEAKRVLLEEMGIDSETTATTGNGDSRRSSDHQATTSAQNTSGLSTRMKTRATLAETRSPGRERTGLRHQKQELLREMTRTSSTAKAARPTSPIWRPRRNNNPGEAFLKTPNLKSKPQRPPPAPTKRVEKPPVSDVHLDTDRVSSFSTTAGVCVGD